MSSGHKMKFVILSGRPACGGHIALCALCKYLAEEGYDARILNPHTCIFRPYNLYKSLQTNLTVFSKKYWNHLVKFAACIVRRLITKVSVSLHIGEGMLRKNKYFNGYIDPSVTGYKLKWLPFVDDDTVVIYPEGMRGNFLGAKNVVRWLLYFNKFAGDDTAYGKQELIFSYSKKFNDYTINPSCRICTVSYFNWDLYKRNNFGEKHGTCYIIRKGKKRPDLPEKFDGIIIDALPEYEKVKAFNSCKYCVSYDLYTAYSSIAAMLGCISVIVPEPGKTRHDYGKDEQYGVALGFDEAEIAFAASTVSKLAERYESNEQRSRENVKYFIDECSKRFHMQ